ncbi:uncharacterized protein [Dermacentor albipictus]|uniref:uncharacterized protein n=1 Tax=Dermacentor albipictus TaxID=60249 RepID=UPI0038FCCDFD
MIASDSATLRIQNELRDTQAGMLKVHIRCKVHIEKVILAQLTMACHGGPGKFARALLHHVFTEEELMGHLGFGNNTKGQQRLLTPSGLHVSQISWYQHALCKELRPRFSHGTLPLKQLPLPLHF